jgi:hypothetical protein
LANVSEKVEAIISDAGLGYGFYDPYYYDDYSDGYGYGYPYASSDSDTDTVVANGSTTCAHHAWLAPATCSGVRLMDRRRSMLIAICNGSCNGQLTEWPRADLGGRER